MNTYKQDRRHIIQNYSKGVNKGALVGTILLPIVIAAVTIVLTAAVSINFAWLFLLLLPVGMMIDGYYNSGAKLIKENSGLTITSYDSWWDAAELGMSMLNRKVPGASMILDEIFSNYANGGSHTEARLYYNKLQELELKTKPVSTSALNALSDVLAIMDG